VRSRPLRESDGELTGGRTCCQALREAVLVLRVVAEHALAERERWKSKDQRRRDHQHQREAARGARLERDIAKKLDLRRAAGRGPRQEQAEGFGATGVPALVSCKIGACASLHTQLMVQSELGRTEHTHLESADPPVSSMITTPTPCPPRQEESPWRAASSVRARCRGSSAAQSSGSKERRAGERQRRLARRSLTCQEVRAAERPLPRCV